MLAKTINIYDLFSECYAGLELNNHEKKPIIFVDDDRINYIKSIFPSLSKVGKDIIKVGIQVKAGSPIRTPSFIFWIDLITKLSESIQNIDFFLIEGVKPKISQKIVSEMKRSQNINMHIFGSESRDIKDLIALVSMMDLVIAPDSSVIHIAAGLSIPSIGIYGPFPSHLRIKYYDKCVGFDSPASCAPCFTHGHKPCKFATEVQSSPCFNEINIDDVVDKSKYLLNKYRNDVFKSFDYKIPKKSETSKFRDEILRIIEEEIKESLHGKNGLEIGSAGDPLIDTSVCIDLEAPYTKCGDKPIHFKGDARKLFWFKDDSLDYIYSSHVFEDFDEDENKGVLSEWTRVIKKNGFLFLLLPDQKRYELYCVKNNEKPNEHHKIGDFGPDYIMKLVREYNNLEILRIVKFWVKDPDEYNFFVMIKKKG